MEPDAEPKCEQYVTEALLAVPDSAEALQTLASVRISQTRFDDAKAALSRSFAVWKDLGPGMLDSLWEFYGLHISNISPPRIFC